MTSEQQALYEIFGRGFLRTPSGHAEVSARAVTNTLLAVFKLQHQGCGSEMRSLISAPRVAGYLLDVQKDRDPKLRGALGQYADEILTDAGFVRPAHGKVISDVVDVWPGNTIQLQAEHYLEQFRLKARSTGYCVRFEPPYDHFRITPL